MVIYDMLDRLGDENYADNFFPVLAKN